MAKQLDRSLGFWSVYTIAVGAMLGSGIFVLPGIAASVAGPWVCISYLVAGLVVLPAVFTKSELATAMPVSGGTYVYVDRAMGPWMGTITGLGTWFSLCSKTAFALAGLGTYLVLFSDWSPLQFCLGILLILLVLNFLGVGKVSNIQSIIVVVCLLSLLFYSYLGAKSIQPELLADRLPYGWDGLLAGAAMCFLSYAGVTKVCSIAEEIHHPERNLPLGMLASQLTVMVLYVVVSWVITGNASYLDMGHDTTPVATAAAAFMPGRGTEIMSVIAILGLISTCNAGVLSSSRFPFAMSRDKLVPEALQKISERYGTPWVAILVTGALLFALVAFLPVKELAKLASGFKVFAFCTNHLALIVLRESGASWYKPSFRTPFYPWTQVFGLLAGIWLLTYLGALPILGIVLGVLLGTAWYLGYVRGRVDRRSVLQHLWGERRILRETELAELAEELTDQAPRVIVPFFGKEADTAHLVRIGAAFVDVGLLEVLRLEEVPQQLRLRDYVEEDQTMRRMSEESDRVARSLSVQLDFHDVVTHNAKEALVHHAEASGAHWIVMTWPHSREFTRFVRHPMAWWLEHAPCDMAMFWDRGADSFKKILVKAEPGPYDSLLMHAADRLAAQNDGEVVVLKMVSTDATPEQVQSYRDYHYQLRRLARSDVKSLIFKTDDQNTALKEITQKFDLLLLGAPPEQAFRNLFIGSREQRVAESAQCSVLSLKTPRHRVHARLEPPTGSGDDHFDLAPFVSMAAVGVRLKGSRKEDAFTAMAGRLAEMVQVGSARSIEAALWERERRQSTALTGGVALMSATCASVDSMVMGIFTLEQSVDFRGKGSERVDVCLVTVAPPAERQTQLWMLARLARMTIRPGFLTALRKSRNALELKDAVRHADQQVDLI